MGSIGGRRPGTHARRSGYLLPALAVGLATAFSAAPSRALDLSDLFAPDLADADWTSGADVFGGIDITDSALFSYGGLTFAPAGLDEAGLRFRLFSAAGQYNYDATVNLGAPGMFTVNREVDVLRAEALVGWQLRAGMMTATLFAGVAYEEQAITPDDPENALAGEHVGAKVALETWFDLASWAWLSADASYATTFDAYSGAVKAGLRPAHWFSFGPEAKAFGDREFDSHRLGGFARWHCGGCDVTVSGGVSGDYDDDTGAYGALSFYRRF